MGRYKEPEYRPHPLLEELRPRLKRTARRSLEKSLMRVGQLHPVLVTMDNYILDGRERFELMKAMGLKPKISQLTFYSGVDAKALPNAGFDLEEELHSSREVIEETGRTKWKDQPARREAPACTKQQDEPACTKQQDEPACTKQQDEPACTKLPRVELLATIPCDGNVAGVRMPKKLIAHLELMALKHAAHRKHARGGHLSTASVPEYIRRLCWQDFINHLGDP